MGAIGGLLGTSGGSSGTGFAGPSAAPIVNPTSAGQLASANAGSQGALASQNALLAALQGQNGLGNQNQVYGQLQGVANGTGPNPAQAMLAQQTGTNVANQAALMAGQRGAGSNVGLLARQAAQTGAGIQQNAIGQAATLQANQSLNAINSAGNIANTQAGNQIAQTNANTTAQQQQQANLLNANAGYNTNLVSGQNNINTVNAGLANTNMQGQQGLLGGALNGIGSGIAAAAAKGGSVKGYNDGGPVSSSSTDSPYQITSDAAAGIGGPAAPAGPQSNFGKFIKGMVTGGQSAQNQASQAPATTGAGALQQGLGNFGKGIGSLFASAPAAAAGARGGLVKALLSPGEKYLSPKEVEKTKKGASPMKVGVTIGGKPKVGGAKNSYANDTVPKNLESGGIVLPRSVTKSKNPEKAAADFVAQIIAKRRGKK